MVDRDFIALSGYFTHVYDVKAGFGRDRDCVSSPSTSLTN